MSLLRIELVKIVLFSPRYWYWNLFCHSNLSLQVQCLLLFVSQDINIFSLFLNTIVGEKWYVLTPFYMRQIIAEFSNWKPFCFCQLSRNQVEWGLLNDKFYNTTGVTIYFAFCKHSDLMPLTRNRPWIL